MVRTALDETGKKILWQYFHSNDIAINIEQLQADAVDIYLIASKSSLKSKQTELKTNIKEQVQKSFIRKDISGFEANSSEIKEKQQNRYGDETDVYGTSVAPIALTGSQPRSHDLAGVVTGKDFPIIEHQTEDGQSSAKFVIAETRYGDNRFTELATTDDKKERANLQTELSNIQKPKYIYEKEIPPISKPKTKASCKCYLTTACVNYKGLPDDCDELMVLRKFRDTYLRNKKNGKELIAHYYEYSPKIVDRIMAHKKRTEYLEGIYSIVTKCVDAIAINQHEYAYQSYSQMVVDLINELTPEYAESIPKF